MRSPSQTRLQGRAPCLSRSGRVHRALCLWWTLPVLLLAMPASAQSAFSGIGRISPAGQNSESPQAAMDSGGNAVFVWENRSAGSIQARVRAAGGALGPVQTLSAVGRTVFSPQVGVDPGGNAVFVWENRTMGTIQARARAVGGGLSPVQTLSTLGESATNPQVGVDGAGNAVFVWLRRDGTSGCGGQGCLRVQTRTRSASGVLSAVQTLTPAGASAFAPKLAVEPDGDAVFVWLRRDGMPACAGFPCQRVQTRVRAAGGTLSETQILSVPDRNAFGAEVGVDPGDAAVFVWQLNDGTSGCGGAGCSQVQARSRAADGTLRAQTQVVSWPDDDATAPDVAVSADRRALITWQAPDASGSCDGAGCSRIWSRPRSSFGFLYGYAIHSGSGHHAFNPHVAMDALGHAVFLWQRFDGTSPCPGSTFPCARVVVRGVSGGQFRSQAVSAPGQDALSPAIAVDPDGGLDPDSADAAAVWSRSDGTSTGCCRRIEAAVQIASSPS